MAFSIDTKSQPFAGVLRNASLEDAEPMLAIYAPFVRETPVSFETEPPALDVFRERLVTFSKSHAWLVLEADREILGYAYGSGHRSRAAYQWTAEVSVYVKPEAQRSGVGRALYAALFEALGRRGYRLLLGGISLPNEASVRLHESMGFEPVGVYRRVGYKLGRWHDVGWWQKPLGEDGAPPSPLLTL